MSGEKFTKGEWEVSNAYPSVDILHEHPAVWSGGYCVAQMCDLEESTANAHLIAAAPEMYHALNDIVKLGLDDDCKINIDSLKRLLAKARGEL